MTSAGRAGTGGADARRGATARRSDARTPERRTPDRRAPGSRRNPLTRRAAAVLIAAALCLFFAHQLGSQELLAMSGLLVGLVAAGFGSVYLGRGSLRVERTTEPDVVTVGQQTRVRVDITETSALPHSHTEWRDRIPPGLRGAASGILPSAGATVGIRARTRTAVYPVVALRRGEHVVGPLALAVRDPFGLVVRKQSVGATHVVTVLPEVFPLPEIPALTASRDGSSKPAPLHVGVGEDDLIARPYLPGDAIRRLHWRASAHRGELMVRQEEHRNNPEATLVIDASVRNWAQLGDRAAQYDRSAFLPGFERAVSLTASIAAHLVDAGYRLSLLGAGVDELSREIGGADADDAIEAAMLDLAVLTPTQGDSRFLDLSPVLSSARPQPLVVVAGDLNEADAAELASLSRFSPLPVALLPSGASPRSIDILQLAGWRCHIGNRTDDFASLWLGTLIPAARAGR
ncbi:DUF58 domain-containing protein [Plantibacter sp. Mn2098]|uniref:DUF58 domain-containing protein n=1 Tax=Plantibacter sp. Mn2098 TaxID=3395266 RepID=UPI003BCAD17B